jgi:hypothetical protein
MTQYPAGPFGQPMMTPPMQTGGVPARPTSWPMVIGIILIVVASLGLLSNGCGGVANLFMPAIMSRMQQQSGQSDPIVQVQMDIIHKYIGWNIANALVMVVLGIILLVGGISMVKRKRSGVSMSVVWAVARIIWAIPASYVGSLVFNDTVEAMRKAAEQNPNAQQPPPGMFGLMQSFGAVGVVIGVVFACAIPVFVLVWLNRPAIKAETAQWQ